MKNQAFLFLIVGLIVGITGTAVALRGKSASPASAVNATGGMMGSEVPTPAATGSSMSMSDMSTGLSGLTGDAFDRTFMSDMVIHHQGAIEMSNMAATQAKHQEVKDLASNIIAAQTGEITQMQQWQKDWGYAK